MNRAVARFTGGIEQGVLALGVLIAAVYSFALAPAAAGDDWWGGRGRLEIFRRCYSGHGTPPKLITVALPFFRCTLRLLSRKSVHHKTISLWVFTPLGSPKTVRSVSTAWAGEGQPD